MNVKIDTKEKFTVITPKEEVLSVNMTEELARLLVAYMQKDIPHVILNLKEVKIIEERRGMVRYKGTGCGQLICPSLQKFALAKCEFLWVIITDTSRFIFDLIPTERNKSTRIV